MALKIYRKARRFVPTWEGNDQLPEDDQLSLAFSTLTIEDMFQVQRDTKVNIFGGVAVDPTSIESIERYWGLVVHILTTRTSDYRNVSVDGVGLSDPAEVISACSGKHMEMLTEIFNYVVAVSMGTVDDAKNSPSPSAPASSEGDTIVSPVSSPASSENATVVAST